eukprot:gene47054-23099_t
MPPKAMSSARTPLVRFDGKSTIVVQEQGLALLRSLAARLPAPRRPRRDPTLAYNLQPSSQPPSASRCWSAITPHSGREGSTLASELALRKGAFPTSEQPEPLTEGIDHPDGGHLVIFDVEGKRGWGNQTEDQCPPLPEQPKRLKEKAKTRSRSRTPG